MVIKEFHQIRRDPRALGILLVFPSALLMFLGYIISMDVQNVSVVVLDEDRSDISRRFIEHLTSYEHFDLVATVSSTTDLGEAVQEGRARIAIHVPRDFGKRIRSGDRPDVQAIVDGTNSLIASSARGTLRAYVNDFSMEMASVHSRPPPIMAEPMAAAAMRSARRPGLAMPRIRMYYNPELRSSVFLIPGLVAFILAVANALATALSIVREKERGTIEQIVLSPLSSWKFILGKTIPYVIISLVSCVLILAAGHYLFDVPMRGSVWFLSLATLVYVIATLGLGLLISSITSSQQVAFTMAALVTMLPTFVLSGFVFPIRNMPFVIQLVTYVVPATYYIRILRSSLLMGAPWTVLLPELGELMALAAILMLVAIIRIHRGGLSS